MKKECGRRCDLLDDWGRCCSSSRRWNTCLLETDFPPIFPRGGGGGRQDRPIFPFLTEGKSRPMRSFERVPGAWAEVPTLIPPFRGDPGQHCWGPKMV